MNHKKKNREMDQDQQPHKPDWGMPKEGHSSEILAWIKLRKRQLGFRRLVLLKTQQFKRGGPKVGENGSEANPADREEEADIPELMVISRELEDLTAKQRELGCYEGDTEDFCLSQRDASELPNIHAEELPWPPPPPSGFFCDVGPIPVSDLGVEPALTKCPSCGAIGITKTTVKIGDTAWILCCISALFGCVGGCCLIPFCVRSLKDVHHSCPNCQTNIHIREKI